MVSRRRIVGSIEEELPAGGAMKVGIDGLVTENPGTEDHVDTVASRLLMPNKARVSWYIINLSDSTYVYLAFSQRVSSTFGIPLPPKQYVQVDIDEDKWLVNREVWAKAEADATPVYIIELEAQS
jgi:hypothetical protein